MRTTVDLPDELYRHAKSEAALRGVRLRDLVEEGLRRVLGTPLATPVTRRVKFPIHRSLHPGALSASEARRAEEQAILEEDTDCAGPV